MKYLILSLVLVVCISSINAQINIFGGGGMMGINQPKETLQRTPGESTPSSLPLFNLGSKNLCKDGGRCSGSHTCCTAANSEYRCCPYTSGSCCKGGLTCCPVGSLCAGSSCL